MVHAPLRGLIALTRLGIVVAAVAAIPVVLKKSKPAAEKFGDALIDLGKKIKEGKKEEPVKASAARTEAPKPASTVKQARPKRTATRKASAQRKPQRRVKG